eukprot:scaffold7001_cov36-Tisochrysis_lutea.AAC.3
MLVADKRYVLVVGPRLVRGYGVASLLAPNPAVSYTFAALYYIHMLAATAVAPAYPISMAAPPHCWRVRTIVRASTRKKLASRGFVRAVKQ